MKRRMGGFTLIEVMAVVGILGILVTLAAPSFTLAMRHRALEQYARTLVSAIYKARSTALIQRKWTSIGIKAGSFEVGVAPEGTLVARYPADPTKFFDTTLTAQHSDLLIFSPSGILTDGNRSPSSNVRLTFTDTKTGEVLVYTVFGSGAVELNK